MKKAWCFALLLFVFFHSEAQKNYSLSASANFDFLTKGLRLNDAGIGATINANFFAPKKLQLRTETSLDHFFGDKILYVDSLRSAINDSRIMFTIKAGPEFFFVPELSASFIYGFTAYKAANVDIRTGGSKCMLTAHLGKNKKGLIGLYYFSSNNDQIHFWGINLGSRIL